MKRAIFLAASLVAAMPASAAVISWEAVLAPGNEVPPVLNAPTGAGGSAFGSIDTDTDLLSWTISWEDLSGDPLGLHFHAPATPEQNAGVVVNVGAISGLNSPTIGSATLEPGQTDVLLDGLYYLNVHTALNPGGEIRGQVSPIPVPATLPLAVGALALLGLVRRRR